MGLLALLVAAFALLWFLPARWALPWLDARLNGVRLQDVSGLVWNGKAARVLSARGENLGALQWQLSRMALFGDNRLHLELHGDRRISRGVPQRWCSQLASRWLATKSVMISARSRSSIGISLFKPFNWLAVS